MNIAIASDHAGRNLRKYIVEYLAERGDSVSDLSLTDDATTALDYPHYAHELGWAVASGRFTCGILICGTGTGMAIAANKVVGVRAANCTNETMARLARAHNDANVLALGERIVGTALAKGIVDAFLATDFEGGRHQRRVDQLENPARP